MVNVWRFLQLIFLLILWVYENGNSISFILIIALAILAALRWRFAQQIRALMAGGSVLAADVLKEMMVGCLQATQAGSTEPTQSNKLADPTSSKALPESLPHSKPRMLPELTERENDIAQAVANGLSNKEIADSLYLSVGTVRNTLSVILEKLALRDRTQLAIYYWKRENKS